MNVPDHAYMDEDIHCFCRFYGGVNVGINGRTYKIESCMPEAIFKFLFLVYIINVKRIVMGTK